MFKLRFKVGIKRSNRQQLLIHGKQVAPENIHSRFTDYGQSLDCVITINQWKISADGNTDHTDLPSRNLYAYRGSQQLERDIEKQTGSLNRKRSNIKSVYIVTASF